MRWVHNHKKFFYLLKKQQEYLELSDYEGHYKELAFSLNIKEESFPPFFSIKHTNEIQTGQGSILNKTINNYIIVDGRIKLLKLEDLFENDLHHQSRLSLILLEKLKDLSSSFHSGQNDVDSLNVEKNKLIFNPTTA